MGTEHGFILAFQAAIAQAPIAVQLDVGPGVIPFVLEATICGIVLAAVANVLEHAQARNLRVKVWIEDRLLVAEIEDDGVGGATGLTKIEARAREGGARIEIDSPAGVGTLLRAEVPIATQPTQSRLHTGRRAGCESAGSPAAPAVRPVIVPDAE